MKYGTLATVASLMFCVGAQAQAVPTPAFRQAASSSGMFEIESGRIALQRSRLPVVRRFAATTVNDHTMTTMAMNGGSPPVVAGPTTSPRHAMMLQQPASAPAPAFNHLYEQMQRQAHREALGLFTAYAMNGDDPSHVRFAQTTLPHLQQPIGMAQRLP
jgi:putative membrane protein